MLCKSPFRQAKGLASFGCGQCLPCRINLRRLWTARILLESYRHPWSVFATLTYSDDFGPVGPLLPFHAARWLKRLRKELHPLRFRYFLVGEYGENTWRAHYHAILFGVPMEAAGAVQRSWGLGFTSLFPLTERLAQYCCGYVTKKLTKEGSPGLYGRPPEFVRMSLQPGLGAAAMEDVASVLSDAAGAALISSLRDVPESLLRGRKAMPLGRYLRQVLRKELGSEDGAPPEGSRVHALRAGKEEAAGLWKAGSTQQRILQVEKRALIWRKKGSL